VRVIPEQERARWRARAAPIPLLAPALVRGAGRGAGRGQSEGQEGARWRARAAPIPLLAPAFEDTQTNKDPKLYGVAAPRKQGRNDQTHRGQKPLYQFIGPRNKIQVRQNTMHDKY
jgi:hypothetical protein